MQAGYMSFVCMDCGLAPLHLGTCREGLAAVRDIPPAILLLDLVLPDGDGLALGQIVRAEFPNVKVLVVTSHCDQATVDRVKAAGMHGFLEKRYNGQETLAEAITAVLSGKEHFPPYGR